MDLEAQAFAPFGIVEQDVELDFNFATRTIVGRTEIKVEPRHKELKEIKLRCRQMDIKNIKVNDINISNFQYDDPYRKMTARDTFTVHQHHLIDTGLTRKLNRDDLELVIPLPPKLRLTFGSTIISLQPRPMPMDDQPRWRIFTISIEYELNSPRDGIHWVGLDSNDMRLPHVYSFANSLAHTQASYMFPCADGRGVKHPWKITITCPRTIGDITTSEPSQAIFNANANGATNGAMNGDSKIRKTNTLDSKQFLSSLSDVERFMDVQVLCAGDMEESDAPTEDKATRRKWVFSCRVPVAARHIGFAIGPFELVDLTKYRESDQDDKLGQSAYSVHGFCLPGRQDELKNICIPIASALDKMSTMTVFYPFETAYKICFVDDLPFDVVDTASFSICSSRLLVPEDVLDPLYESTREVIRAVFSQWIGVKITAKDAHDNWIIIGGSYFLADQFMAGLWGRNEQRFRLKMTVDKIFDLDHKKSSIFALGAELGVDSWIYDFLRLKAPTVLTMLHHRIVKSNGRNGVDKMFWRALLDDQTGKIEDGEIDTDRFMRIAEKVAHYKFDPFFQQWVFGAGCPMFKVHQRFNKKKLVVELTIVQGDRTRELTLDAEPNLHKSAMESFMSEIKEDEEGFNQMGSLPLFTGPMTVRIHEADGTPYEHIVDIKELSTKVEIPYNTKYKRLKRNKRQKERAAAAAGVDVSGDAQDDVLLYCLGDVLSTEQEMKDWELVDWSKEDESRMNDEHYEWIRLDKDFEWIASIQFNQPHYMFVSQLQQDNDVVAQVESLQFIAKQQPYPIVSTILIRTLMDERYFYGIRVMAAHALTRCAQASLNWIGLMHLEKAFQKFYCFENSAMTRSNDFMDVRSYAIQVAIPEAVAKIRDENGKAPDRVKQFFIDKLKFNDNSNNQYSDAFYVATLLSSLAYSITVDRHKTQLSYDFGDHQQELREAAFKRVAIDEIHRYRRIDEWIPSFHNLYTVTALDSMKVFMLNGVSPRRLEEFVQYTRKENSDPIRIKAYECLVELGAFRNPHIMALFIVSFFTEPSPYLRNKIWSIISRAIGSIARGEMEAPKTASPVAGGLVFDDPSAIEEARQNAAATRQTLTGATVNLQSQISDNNVLKEVLIEALRSSTIDMDNFLDLLTLCRILYEAKDSFKIKLRLPQYWSARNLDGHIILFKQTGRVRTKPFTKLEDRLPPSMRKKEAPKRNFAPASEGIDVDGLAEPSPKRPRISPPDDVPSTTSTQAPKTTIKFGGPKIRLSTAPKAASPEAPVPSQSPTSPSKPIYSPSPKPPKPPLSHTVVLKLAPMRLAKFPSDSDAFAGPPKPGDMRAARQPRSPGIWSPAPSSAPSGTPAGAPPPNQSPSLSLPSNAKSPPATALPPPSLSSPKPPVAAEEVKKPEEPKSGGMKLKLSFGKKSSS